MRIAPVAQPALPEQRAGVAETLARAFQTEPAFSFMIPDAARRSRGLRRAFPAFVRGDMAHGIVYATPALEAITMWRRPGEAADGLFDTIMSAPAMLAGFGSGIGRALKIAGSIQHHLPRNPVWYLHFAGCDPAHQGKGFGGAAIRAGLDRADADGVPAYLETADPNNVGIYRSFGFETIHRWTIVGGPEFWGMQRPIGG